MKTGFRPYVACVAVVFLLAPLSDALDLQTIIEGVQRYDTPVRNGQGRLIVKQTYGLHAKAARPTLQDKTEGVFYAFDGVKVRCDEKPDVTHVFDGEKTITLFLATRINELGNVEEYWSACIRDGSRCILPYYNPRVWGLRFFSRPIGTYLSEFAIEYVGTEWVKDTYCELDEMCEVVDACFPYKRDGRVRFWISAQKGFRVCKMEAVYSANQRKLTKYIAYRKYEDDVWFPWKSYYTHSNLNASTGKWDVYSTFSMEMEEFEVNTLILAQTFQLDLSLPESVYDFRLGRNLTPSEVQELR